MLVGRGSVNRVVRLQIGNKLETTTCLDCAVEIQQKTADRYCGRCKHCSARTLDENEIFTPSNHLLVYASFFPGFAEDLTSWETFLHFEGQLLQAINWDTPVNPPGRRVHERRTVQVTTQQLGAVTVALSKVDILGLQQLKGHLCMDGAGHMHLHSRKFGLKATISAGVINSPTRSHGILLEAQSSLSAFRSAWNVIDCLAPYTTKMHRNKRRTRR